MKMVIGMPYCKECGRRLPADAKFCPNCGTKILAELPTRPIKKPKPSEEPQKREITTGRKALHWAISAVILYVVSAISLLSWWGAYNSIEVRYLGAPAPSPPYLGVFFLILAFIFTGIAAQIHYRG